MDRNHKPMEMSLVAAIDRQCAIGRDGAMPWHLPDDLRRFKALTLGHPVLMGRKTAEAIGRALPGRRNLVLTRSAAAPYPDQEPVASIEAATAAAGAAGLMVIGGGEVYRLTLPLATWVYLTRVDTVAEGADTFFPRLDPAQWIETAHAAHPADARHAVAFDFVDYRRRDTDRDATRPG
jgi:dihydrofolate reductase